MEIEFFGHTWLIVSCIIGIIGLIVIGVVNHDSLGGESIPPLVMGVIAGALFWPILLALVVGIGIVIIPLFIGKYIGKGVMLSKKKKKQKLDSMNDVDKILNAKKGD